MFTGIIQGIGVIKSKKGTKSGIRIGVELPGGFRRVEIGSSVAMSGVCLSVVKKERSEFSFDVIAETIRMTTLGKLDIGDKVNLESSLRVGDEVSGHFVMGHVDGVGAIKSLSHEAREAKMVIQVPKRLMKYITNKGSITIDGVSLTVTSIKGNQVMVALIPHTLQNTILGSLNKGDKVNIEVDIIARYLDKLKVHKA